MIKIFKKNHEISAKFLIKTTSKGSLLSDNIFTIEHPIKKTKIILISIHYFL